MIYKVEKHYICRVCNKTVDKKDKVVMLSDTNPDHACTIKDLMEVDYGYPVEVEDVAESTKN